MNAPGKTVVHQSKRAQFLGNEIVVGLRYEALVRERLGQCGARPVVTDRDARLGLARMTVDAARGVEALGHANFGAVERARQDAIDETGHAYDLDVLTRCVRAQFRSDYMGWIPTLGKNRIMEIGRTVDQVSGQYVIDMGGGGDGGPLEQPDHVIDMGAVGKAVGRPRREYRGKYVVARRPDGPGSGVRVGIVDTKLAAHEYFDGGYVAAPSEVYPSLDAVPSSSGAQHATFVTGLVLHGAPGALVVTKAPLNARAQADSWTVAKAIADLADDHVHIVNLSLGCATDDGQPPLVLDAALRALASDTLVVAAAGNHGLGDGSTPPPSWPAAFEQVVAVGALDGDRAASWSPDAPWVDVLAPGAKVFSTYAGRRGVRFARWSGTSFASAIVSGAIAARVRGGDCGGAHTAFDRLVDGSVSAPSGQPMVAVDDVGWATR